MMKTLRDQLEGLDTLLSELLGGVKVDLHPIPGEVPVIQVSIENRQELPIFITCSDVQILCMCYLWSQSEILVERKAEMLETMLSLNPSVPLSSFGLVGDRFVLFGAMTRHAHVSDVAEEVAVLSDNAVDALEALSEFLL